jgi:xanthine dehydrogenase accessory factor
VYDIASSVAACLRAGTRVDVAWVVHTRGFSSRDGTEALAITPGGGRVGALMSGALDDQVAASVRAGESGRVLDLHVGDVDAMVAGLACGGDARCLVVPVADLPAGLWQRLQQREPVCLVTRLDGDDVAGVAMFTQEAIAGAGDDAARLFGRGVSDSAVSAGTVVTALWPVPGLTVVGSGALADALVAVAGVLGWTAQVVTDEPEGLAELAVIDKVVVISHDVELAGPALAAALSGAAGYVGAVGSRHTQQARAEWLAARGVTDLTRVHGPAGLDIGANTPAEIAVAVVAEALAVTSGRAPASLRDRPGPIHAR